VHDARDRGRGGPAGLVTVEATALDTAYRTRFAAGGLTGLADTRKDGVGGTAGMRPHELLEAALATCMAITARMAIERMGIIEPKLGVRVWLDRSEAATVVNYGLAVDPRLDDLQRRALAECVERSRIRRTLTLPFAFAVHDLAADADGQAHLPT